MMSVRNVVLSAFTAAAALPVVASAQEPRQAPQARARVSISGDTVLRDRIRLITQRRARLGVTVDLRPSARDSIGATIQSVTPGGPAAKAGIRSDDIITRIDGKSLVTGDDKKRNEEESPPGLRLIEIAAQLKPNDNVSLEYVRDGARKTTTLVAGDEPILAFEYPGGFGLGEGARQEAFPRMRIEQMMPGVGRGGRLEAAPGIGFNFAFGGPFMHLELAPLNSDLGQYFGTTEGVLVIDVPKESTLGVKGGDVILNVDGRKATSPGSLFRILRSYDPGDSFKLEIMRNKSRMTVTGKLEKQDQ